MRHYQIYAGGHVCGSMRIWLWYADCTRENGLYSGDYFDEYEWTPRKAFFSLELAENEASLCGGLVISLPIESG